MELTRDIVLELFEYDHLTGRVYWKKRDREWFESDRSMKYFNNRFAGKEAGSSKRSKQEHCPVKIKVLGRMYFAHRIAWLYMTDEPLPDEIDHQNGDPADNRWQNLKASNHSDNMMNKKKYKNNKSGSTGVSWKKDLQKWMAYCQEDGKQKYLGTYSDKKDAENSIVEYRILNGYHENHGRS